MVAGYARFPVDRDRALAGIPRRAGSIQSRGASQRADQAGGRTPQEDPAVRSGDRGGFDRLDSGGTPLANSPPAALLQLILEAVFRPGDPVPVVGLLKHPMLALGMERAAVRHAVETIELVALRGGTGRPDILKLGELFEERLIGLAGESRKPFWFARITESRIGAARAVLAAI